MKSLARIIVSTAVAATVFAPAAPARADDCLGKQGIDYLYCRLVGGCIASGPEAIDPVVCD